MPTSLFHLNVSKKIAEKYPEYDTPNFYIGAIAPDAVNLNGFAERSIRWEAHKRAKDLDEWKQNIIKFFKQEKDNFKKDYLLGYVVHVLTDIVADELYYRDGLYEDIVKNRTSEDKAFGFFKDQIQVYENSQLNEEWWKDIKEKLKNIDAYPINNISKNEIYGWRDKVLNDYSKKTYEPYDYVTPEIVNICFERVIKIIEDSLIQISNHFYVE